MQAHMYIQIYLYENLMMIISSILIAVISWLSTFAKTIDGAESDSTVEPPSQAGVK
jgi:hypothetical protein